MGAARASTLGHSARLARRLADDDDARRLARRGRGLRRSKKQSSAGEARGREPRSAPACKRSGYLDSRASSSPTSVKKYTPLVRGVHRARVSHQVAAAAPAGPGRRAAASSRASARVYRGVARAVREEHGPRDFRPALRRRPPLGRCCWRRRWRFLGDARPLDRRAAAVAIRTTARSPPDCARAARPGCRPALRYTRLYRHRRPTRGSPSDFAEIAPRPASYTAAHNIKAYGPDCPRRAAGRGPARATRRRRTSPTVRSSTRRGGVPGPDRRGRSRGPVLP